MTTSSAGMQPPIEVQHDANARSFEAVINGLHCSVDYDLRKGVMDMHHTGVPRPIEGRGIAAQLVRAALEYARSHGFKVVPYCSYVRSYMRRNPDTHELLASGYSL